MEIVIGIPILIILWGIHQKLDVILKLQGVEIDVLFDGDVPTLTKALSNVGLTYNVDTEEDE